MSKFSMKANKIRSKLILKLKDRWICLQLMVLENQAQDEGDALETIELLQGFGDYEAREEK